MSASDVKQYQATIVGLLRQIYPGVEVKKEWSSAFGAHTYCPRVDIAVGPFSVTHGEQFTEAHDELMSQSGDFILGMIQHHLCNVRLAYDRASPRRQEEPGHRVFERLVEKNRNARCLMVIEIENRTTRKHLMGGAINAAALGRIGVAVAWNPAKLRAFAKLKRYLDYLASVRKNTFDTSNLLILDRDQFLQAVQDALRI